MNKLVLKFFGFLKSFTQLLKILIAFSILLLLLYWVQNITQAHWGWLGFISPFFDFILGVGSSISNSSLDLFGAVFEFKYVISLMILIALYALLNGVYIAIECLESMYGKGRKILRKIEEDTFNIKTSQQHNSEQKKINNYHIYVETSIKKKFSHKEFNINLEEQNKIMNKFLISKTEIMPVQLQNGFLYSFNSFENIDKILEHFFKLIHSDSPLNYVICVQIKDKNAENQSTIFNALIELQLQNKITMTSETAYRYKFNECHRYGTSQLGIFQKNDFTFEVQEFIEI